MDFFLNFYLSFFLQYFFICFLFFSSIYAKKILLTGGAGFIGSHVAQKLLERGDSVVIIDNMNDAYDQRIKEHNLHVVKSSDIHNKLLIYKIDICDSDTITALCIAEKPDVICHLAARAGVRFRARPRRARGRR